MIVHLTWGILAVGPAQRVRDDPGHRHDQGKTRVLEDEELEEATDPHDRRYCHVPDGRKRLLDAQARPEGAGSGGDPPDVLLASQGSVNGHDERWARR